MINKSARSFLLNSLRADAKLSRETPTPTRLCQPTPKLPNLLQSLSAAEVFSKALQPPPLQRP
jgi:hypothetical protein